MLAFKLLLDALLPAARAGFRWYGPTALLLLSLVVSIAVEVEENLAGGARGREVLQSLLLLLLALKMLVLLLLQLLLLLLLLVELLVAVVLVPRE